MTREHSPKSDTAPIRYPFSVTRAGDTVFIAMECPDGVTRVRHMRGRLFDTVSELCLALLVKSVVPEAAAVPRLPGFLCLAKGGIGGACRAILGAHRLESGKVERVIALYDEDDDTTPVLLLIEEQIDDFLSRT